jgi:sarcosine oxidase gamma subunit
VIVEARGADAFRVHVRGSFAGYLASWLIDPTVGLDGAGVSLAAGERQPQH